MKEIIQLLPDQLANQIAAGEVIQRPASAVKELMENALDAGATEIHLIIKDAGKELIMVVDNGKGMNPIDARMCFERHATSKIRNIDDLFAIQTMGFRGEALPSIAAVSQVELKTKTESDELGTLLQIEGGEIVKQEPISCPTGTSFAIRNLFYNVPARRKFLKSNTSEYKHIINEFTQIALAFPDIAFKLTQNKTEQFNLQPTNLKGRIVDLLGNRREKNLIPISEKLEFLEIEGFVGKPEAATKVRGNQFFFVNNRYIRSPYFHHAVKSAFEGLIEKDTHPFYVLRFTIDFESVDVNVHPSKQEVKFDDEKMIYAYLHAAIKHALARFNVMPSIDFTLNPDVQNLDAVRLPFTEEQRKITESGYLAHTFSSGGKSHFRESKKDKEIWEQQRKAFFDNIPDIPEQQQTTSDVEKKEHLIFKHSELDPDASKDKTLQWNNFLLVTVKSGIMVVHKSRARERIAYENLKQKMQTATLVSQQQLFPFERDETPADLILIEEALPFLQLMGFDLKINKPNTLIVSGLPPGLNEHAGNEVLNKLIAQISSSPLTLKDPNKEKLLQNMAKSIAYYADDSHLEPNYLMDELFACQEPQYTPTGNSVFTILKEEHLLQLL